MKFNLELHNCIYVYVLNQILNFDHVKECIQIYLFIKRKYLFQWFQIVETYLKKTYVSTVLIIFQHTFFDGFNR